MLLPPCPKLDTLGIYVAWIKLRASAVLVCQQSSSLVQASPRPRPSGRPVARSMGSSSSRFASCAESILTGTTKREQWLEERCTELARQNS